jgi:hypothetical protein
MKTKSRPKAAKEKHNNSADYTRDPFLFKPSRMQRTQRRSWLRGGRR